MKSTAMTATDEATTALVVARPTPWVPPLVRRPTWHPMVTMTNPRKNGLISPIQASSMNRPSMIEVQYKLEATRSWVTVVTKLVRKDQEMVVTGHRWSLQFEKGSLSEDATVTIQDYDANVLDVQFGPHGTQFPVPVTLTVDLSNTDADPSAPRYNGCQPTLYWLNEQTNAWEEVPGRLDSTNRKLIVKLPHFSRYVVGTKAGWKHQPQREDD